MTVQLHTFCDGSEESFSSAVYLQVQVERGVDVVLVASTVRVFPVLESTISELGLLAAVLGVSLAKVTGEAF